MNSRIPLVYQLKSDIMLRTTNVQQLDPQFLTYSNRAVSYSNRTVTWWLLRMLYEHSVPKFYSTNTESPTCEETYGQYGVQCSL